MIRPFIIALFAIVSLTTFAQTSSVSTTDNYSRLSLNLGISQPVSSGHGVAMVSNHNLYGIGADYLFGINVTGNRLPLFLEVGPELNYLHRTDEVDYWDSSVLTLSDTEKTQMLTLSTPIDLTYHYRLNDALVAAPFLGLDVTANLLATNRALGHTTDLFDHGANRLQLGCNIGCGIYYNRLFFALRYAPHLTPFMSQGKNKESYQNFSFQLGIKL